VHVHMNYGGAYRNTPQRLIEQATAENLSIIFNLVVNKEQRVPDIAYFSAAPDAASTQSVLLSHGQEFHTSYWGHLGLLGLGDHYLVPGYVGYSNTSAASLFPSNATVADLAHQQGALVGYVHPFDQEPDPARDPTLTNELPVDAALGKIDYYEVVGFSDHRASAAVWYRLLNCGIRLAAAAGTDAMANFASLRGPVGLNRVYVSAETLGKDKESRLTAWLSALKAGRTMATNGPLLNLEVEGREPGAEIVLAAQQQDIHYRGFLRSNVPIDHLELVFNGKVVRQFDVGATRASADLDGAIRIEGPGWLLLRAWNEHADPDVFDIYPYATTNPVFFTRTRQAQHCGPDADYLLAWLERLRVSADAHSAYNSEQEKQMILGQIAAARSIIAERR
jgi:TolB protein